MLDDFFAFAAQLVLTPPERHKRIGAAQVLGVMSLVLLSTIVGSVLLGVPLRWIGILALAPWALALHAWQHRNDPARQQYRRGALTTFAVTLALGGDNLAVWIPLLRANDTLREVLTIALFALWEMVFLIAARSLVNRPRVIEWGTKFSRSLMPVVYVGLGVLVLIECGTFA
jgi:cadmium resistance protein CadD (predicted permease)